MYPDVTDAPLCPTDRAEDRGAWTWSILLTVAFGGLYMAYTLLWMPVVHGRAVWVVSGDTWILTEPARFVANGALGYLYSARPGYYALPLSAILMAPAVWLSDSLRLVGGYPFPVPEPTAWLVVGPFQLLAGIPALRAARRLAFAGGLRGRQLVVVQLFVVAVVLYPCAFWGHPEDVLATTFLLGAVAAQRDARTDRAALLLALAICSKQWALVAVPFLLVATPAGRRWRAGLVASVPPLVVAALPLSVDWWHASRSLLFQKFPVHGLYGHQSMILPVLTSVLGAHGSELSRLLEVAAAPVVAVAVRRRDPDAQLAALGGVLALRIVLEPLVFPYYLAPGALLLGLAATLTLRRIPVQLLWWLAVLAVWSILQTARTGWWWTGMVVISLAAASAWYREAPRGAAFARAWWPALDVGRAAPASPVAAAGQAWGEDRA